MTNPTMRDIYLPSNEKQLLGIYDYAVLAGMLITSIGIGAFYAIRDRNKQSTTEFLMAGRSMSVLPVAMSLMASFLSSTTIIGYPVEIYVRGSHVWLVLIPVIIASVAAAEIFVPIFYRLNLTSVNTVSTRYYELPLVTHTINF